LHHCAASDLFLLPLLPSILSPFHTQGEYVKDQMGLENLSHHFLPLLRYRRQKYRQKMGYYPPELTALPVKAKLVP
jgi:hypothetical protein